MSYLIDTHCHFDFEQFDNNRAEIWQACLDNNIKALFIPSVKAASFERTLRVCVQHPSWFPMLGLHPYFIEQHAQQDLATLEQYLHQQQQDIIAVGEIGLDFYEGRASQDKQIQLFKAQLKLAQAFDKPVVIHSRKANDEVLKLLNDLSFEQGGIIHAFSGSMQQAERLIDKGFMLGFGGAVTYERALRLRKLVQDLPLSAISFETDSPDMPPSFLAAGIANHPSNLAKIVELIAQLRGQPKEELIATHHMSIKALFSLSL